MIFLLHIIFIVLYGLVALFGIGPVLLADGTMNERIWTLCIVLIIFAALIFVHRFSYKKIR